MKKYIKFALVAAAFALSVAFGAAAQAAPQFGAGNSPYLPLVQVQVCGQNGNGCNPSPYAYSPSISGVQPGDNVWVMIYYNNIGTGTATGTKATLSPQTSGGAVSSFTVNGTLSANNASAISGSATVNLNSAQTLTYYSTKVYGHNAQLLTTSNGTEIFNGGVNIGDVLDSSSCPSTDTFCHQGVVVVTYKVGQTVPPPQQSCVINNFTASPSYVNAGGSSTLNWSTSGCASAIVNGGIVYVNSLSGSQNTGTLYNTTSYTLTATGYNGSPVSQTVTVSVGQQNQSCYISYFSASPNYVSYGGNSTLTWQTYGANSVTISGLNYGGYNQSASGSIATGAIYGSQTFTLTANCQNGQSQSQTVTVSTNGNNQQCYVNSFYASPAVVTSGNSTTLYWTTSGASSVMISGLNNYYNQSLSGSAQTSAIYGNQTFTLTAYCQNGQSQVQTVNVSTSQPAQNTQVFTGAPTAVAQTSARLNGNLIQSGNLSTEVYFQWGTSTNYGFSTAHQTLYNSNSFWNAITGLSADTVYHYRAVAVNSSGTYYGDDQAFSTLAATVYVPPTVITVTSGTGSGSNLIALDINNNQQINACVGNIVSYLVTYKNISGHRLDNVVLQVLLPEDVEFQSSNPGIWNASDRTITLAIGSLIKDQTGTMNVTGVVKRSAINRNLIVAQATIAFTNPSTNNSQETAIAYGMGNTNNCNSLAGLALFGDGFWPTTLIGWLALILILLLLIYLAIMLRRNYRDGRPAQMAYGNNMGGGSGVRQNMNAHYEDMDVPTYNNH